jgi:uncharacterized membrane protein
LIINIVIAVLIAIIPYLIKYKKRYNLIAGFTDYEAIPEGITKDKMKKEAIRVSNYAFLFSLLIIILSVLNYVFNIDARLFDSKILIDFSGGIIIIVSLFSSIAIYFINKKNNVTEEKF